MEFVIISSKFGLESSSYLAEYMGVEHKSPFDTGNFNFETYDAIFKYGISKPIKVKPGAIVLNKAPGTKLAINKIKTLDAFSGESFCIPYSLKYSDAIEWVKSGTVVARTRNKGHDGEGVIFCENKQDIDKVALETKFYTKYINHTNEIRVNVWRNKVVTVYDKINNDGTFKFNLWKGVEEHPQLKEIIDKIYAKTNLDWYGLDLLRDETGQLYLLEINSSPVLYPVTLKKLAVILKKEVLNEKG